MVHVMYFDRDSSLRNFCLYVHKTIHNSIEVEISRRVEFLVNDQPVASALCRWGSPLHPTAHCNHLNIYISQKDRLCSWFGRPISIQLTGQVYKLFNPTNDICCIQFPSIFCRSFQIQCFLHSATKLYSKASRYTASRSTDLGDTRFLFGSQNT